MKKYFLFLLLVNILFSCSEYKDPLDLSIKAGDIYCKDGSIVRYEKIDSTQTPIGIIFWVNENHSENIKGYAIGLDNIDSVQWANKNTNIKNISNNPNDFNGFSNTVAMLFENERDSTLSILSALLTQSYMDNISWFIPSAGQLREIYKNRISIQKSLKNIGGEPLLNWYWSSTQDNINEETTSVYALTVSTKNGSINSTDKRYLYPIRPIIEIKK